MSRRQPAEAAGLARIAARDKRIETNASHTNHVVVVARVAAPSPTKEKRTPATIATGTARSVGNHTSRHSSRRRNANASRRGAANVATTVNLVSILCADACHESFRHPATLPRQSRRKRPSRNAPIPARTRAPAPIRPTMLGVSASQNATPTTTTRIPVRLSPIWLKTQALWAVSAPRYEVSSAAELYGPDCARPPATQPTVSVISARTPQTPAARRSTSRSIPAFGKRIQGRRAASSATTKNSGRGWLPPRRGTRFAAEDIDDTLVRLRPHGAELVG